MRTVQLEVTRLVAARLAVEVKRAGEVLHAARCKLRAAMLHANPDEVLAADRECRKAREALDDLIDRHNQIAFDLSYAQNEGV